MPTMSIEILFPAGINSIPSQTVPMVGVDLSSPPVSDRGPSPLWQAAMSELGGTLLHLFDPKPETRRRRWAYEILDVQAWSRIRFKPPVARFVWSILETNLDRSDRDGAVFFTDAQGSNAPRTFSRRVSLDAFRSYHDRCGIRLNTAIFVRA